MDMLEINTNNQNSPQNNTPQNNTPQNNTPQNNTPQNNTPQNNTPQNNTSQNNIIQNTSVENINGITKEPPIIVKKINNTSIEWGIMLTIQDNLNLRIGSTTWKKYISAAFWNYISTPINFTITLFTAFSAGQTGTQTIYLTQDQLFYILMVTFLLSVINTFFKLKEKAVSNYNACNQYNKFGSEFEEIYFTPISSDEGVIERLNKYKTLQKKMNDYNEEENVENVNYLTTVLYYSIKYFFKHRMKRVNKDERFWLLDGKPNNIFYPRNRYWVNVDNYFVEDFNFADDVDGNNLYTRFKYRNDNCIHGHNVFIPQFLMVDQGKKDSVQSIQSIQSIQGIELQNKSNNKIPDIETGCNGMYSDQVCCAPQMIH